MSIASPCHFGVFPEESTSFNSTSQALWNSLSAGKNVVKAGIDSKTRAKSNVCKKKTGLGDRKLFVILVYIEANRTNSWLDYRLVLIAYYLINSLGCQGSVLLRLQLLLPHLLLLGHGRR